MAKDDSDFEALEKQLAKDALEKALKDLYGEIIKEIENNKKDFSAEIKTTLTSFKENLEQKVTEEIDKKIASLFTKHFQNTSAEVKSSFEKEFSPLFKKTDAYIDKLQTQGETTLSSWGKMMSQYKSLWARPFIIMFLVAILTGTLSSLISSYFMVKSDREARRHCENLFQWYLTETKQKEALATSQENNQVYPSGEGAWTDALMPS